MLNKQIFKLTVEGKAEYEEELRHYKEDLRPLNVQSIADARAQGDLSENADYSAAREEQARIEVRILELENILKNATIITADHSDIVSIGKIVEVKITDKNTNKLLTTEKLKIVSSIEADPFNGKISEDSPVGKALIGRKVTDGDMTVVTETGKEIKVELINVN